MPTSHFWIEYPVFLVASVSCPCAWFRRGPIDEGFRPGLCACHFRRFFTASQGLGVSAAGCPAIQVALRPREARGD